MYNNIGDFLIKSVENYPEYLAIVTSEKSLTYKELEDKIAYFQSKLKVYTKDIILILLPNSIDYAVAYFSMTLQGATIVPIYWESTEYEIHRILNFIKPDVIITNIEGAKRIQDKETSIFTIDYIIYPNKISEKVIKNAVDSDEIALILQTSGTTSEPKFVPLTHKNLIFNVIGHCNSLELGNYDNVLITLPMNFGYCNTSQFLAHIYLSSMLYIYQEEIILPSKLMNIIEKNRISIMTMVPSGLNLILEFLNKKGTNQTNLNSLKYICFGGGSLSSNKYSQLKSNFKNVKFVQTYGLTEAGPRVTTLIIEKDYDPTNVGKPIKGIEIQIRNIVREVNSINNVGEIWIKSPGQMKGYYQITTNSVQKGFLNTGDLGYIDKHGCLHIIGRKKNIIKFSGYRIHAEEVEQFIYNNTDVKKCVLISEKNENYGEIAILKIEKTINMKDTEEDIMKLCKKNLTHYKVPRKIEFVDYLDNTSTGKIKRH